MDLLTIVQTINTYLTDYILIALLVACGLYYTIKTRFVQIRCFGEGFKKTFAGYTLYDKKSGSGMSSFQSLATAIAGQVGTGNIVGASAAILTGGPGAIFWMWIVAFLGMSTIYAEATLAQKTKRLGKDGQVLGGPVYYIKEAFKGKLGTFLAGFFAIAAILALGFFGLMVQSNSIGSTIENAFGIPSWICGLVLLAVTLFVFFGTTDRLAAQTEKIVPFMACLFIIGSVAILVIKFEYLPAAFGAIFYYAFTPQALIGGGIGAALKIAISQGVKRGLFSNEAGMGSTPHAHAQANVEHPHDQGVVAMIGVFLDTFVVLTLNALVIIVTCFCAGGPLDPSTFGGADYATVLAASGLDKTNIAQYAFGTVFGEKIGSMFVAVCLLFFAYSTILSWNLYGKINFKWLFKEKVVWVFVIISAAFVFLGTLASNDLVWELTDMFNNLMVIPNVIALLALGKLVAPSCKEGYERKAQRKLAAKIETGQSASEDMNS
ncbi:MAG: sodium:alanine symporter family protein [Clostridia bacterium]|nr:sodium:alanine symporter family protein [Clostridia bacterium]